MLLLDRFGLDRLGGDATSDLRLGAVGLALVSGTVSWLDLWLLRRRVQKRFPDLRLPWRASGRILIAAVLGAAPALAVWQALPAALHAAIASAVVLSIYGAGFLGAASLLRVPELAVLGRRFG